MKNLLSQEQMLWGKGFKFIAGIDEVGRGCLAGPVIAAAVVLPSDLQLLNKLEKVNDSKLLSEKLRKELFPLIQEVAVDYSIGIVSANVIDQINILQATFLAMRRAISGLSVKTDFLLVDGNKKIPCIDIKQTAIIKGDSNCLSIGAASILAKVIRDEIMSEIAIQYPGYDFEKHKGYPTKVHRSALEKLGLTDIHRKTFCKSFVTQEQVEESVTDEATGQLSFPF